jgi:hypothetical protein
MTNPPLRYHLACAALLKVPVSALIEDELLEEAEQRYGERRLRRGEIEVPSDPPALPPP